MTANTKKILAREFLFFLLVFCITSISFAGIWFYRYYQSNKIEQLGFEKNLLEKRRDSLLLDYNKKVENQSAFFVKYFRIYSFSSEDRKSKYFDDYGIPIKGRDGNLLAFLRLNELYKQDSLSSLFDTHETFIAFYNAMGYKSLEQLNRFIEVNFITQLDIENTKTAKLIDDKIIKIANEISGISKAKNAVDNPVNIAGWILLILFLILFALRYLYYGASWSITVLRNK